MGVYGQLRALAIVNKPLVPTRRLGAPEPVWMYCQESNYGSSFIELIAAFVFD